MFVARILHEPGNAAIQVISRPSPGGADGPLPLSATVGKRAAQNASSVSTTATRMVKLALASQGWAWRSRNLAATTSGDQGARSASPASPAGASASLAITPFQVSTSWAPLST